MPTGDLKLACVVMHHKVATPPEPVQPLPAMGMPSCRNLSSSASCLLNYLRPLVTVGRCPRELHGATFYFPLQVRIRKETILSKKERKLTILQRTCTLPHSSVCATRGTRGAKSLSRRASEAAATAHREKNHTRLSNLGIWSKRKSTEHTLEL